MVTRGGTGKQVSIQNAGTGGSPTAVANRIVTSPWHLRGIFVRTEGSSHVHSNSGLVTSHGLSDHTADGVFCRASISNKRTGIVDGQEVTFELVEGLNSRPQGCRAKRHERFVEVLNPTPSPLEIRCRWAFLRYDLVSVTILYFFVFLALNFVFAGLWSIQDDRCCDDPGMSYTEIFDFAIQTSTTIGYGGYVPQGYLSNFFVVILSFLTLILNTVYGGVLFLRFVTPSAKIDFSDVMTLSNVNGIPCLELRLCNADGARNLLTDINVRLSYSYELKFTDEKGECRSVYNSQDLMLLSDKRATLDEFPWVIRHMIDESSPLYGLDFREFPGSAIYNFTVSITGTQVHTGGPVFRYSRYLLEDLLIGYRFVDQTRFDRETMKGVLHHGKLSDTVPHPVWYPTRRHAPTDTT